MLRRLFKVAVLVFLALVLAGALFLCFERVRGWLALRSYQRELRAGGFTLTPRGYQPAPPGETNGSPEIARALSKLKKGVILPGTSPPRLKMGEDGLGLAGYRQESWPDSSLSNAWEQAVADLTPNAQPLEQIRTALERPVIQEELDFSQGPMMRFPLLYWMRPLTRWYAAAMKAEIRKGDTHRAAEYLRAQIQLLRLVSEDRTAITEIVRTSTATIAMFSTWDALQADEWTDADLSSIQDAWEKQRFVGPMQGSLEAEMADSQTGFEVFRKSNESTFLVFFGMEDYFPLEEWERPAWERAVRRLSGGEKIARGIQRLYCRIWRFTWLDQYETRSLKEQDRIRRALKSAQTIRSLLIAEAVTMEMEKSWLDRNLYDRLRYPESRSPLKLSRVIEKAIRAETERSLVLCAVAVKRFTARHGHVPESLAAMQPEFLVSIPMDYMDGQAIRYRQLSEQRFLLYSVGADKVDGGGNAKVMPGKTYSENVWERQDFVWPWATTNSPGELH